MNSVETVKGGTFIDKRGIINYVNDFSFSNVARFYVIMHKNIDVIRAWQGHKTEKKIFFVVSGTFVISWVKIDNWENPSTNLKAEHKILSESESTILSIPAGYANGLKALEKDSKLLVFSEFELEQSSCEKIRYQSDLWFDWEKLESKN
jgi:dTDP-4-dehydrorhamnose 3,5-epimerase-like enzyme